MSTLSAHSLNAAPPEDAVVTLPAPWRLHYSDLLDDARMAYRLVGPPDAPVVAVLGGISSNRFVSSCSERGWWGAVAGPARGVDTDRFRVLGIDFLGGSGDSSAPAAGGSFPALSSLDQAQALGKVLDHLRLDSLHAIVGASYGGMVALAFAERMAHRVKHIIVMSAADRAHPLSTAWRSIQRQIVREALARADGPAGLRLARALAMTTYRSPAEFAARFGGAPTRGAERFRFPIEDYLFARGDHYAQQYRAESFLALSESIDLHEVDAAKIITPATLIAIREDQLVPFDDMRRLAARLAGPGNLIELNSLYGHDAFLKEPAMINPIIQAALRGIAS